MEPEKEPEFKLNPENMKIYWNQEMPTGRAVYGGTQGDGESYDALNGDRQEDRQSYFHEEYREARPEQLWASDLEAWKTYEEARLAMEEDCRKKQPRGVRDALEKLNARKWKPAIKFLNFGEK